MNHNETFTALPSVKGGVTLPVKLRNKYKIGKDTPLQITDEGHGILKIKIMKMSDYEDVQLTEDDKTVRLTFPKGVDPAVVLKKIEEANG